MKISLIAAISENNVIGNNNTLPWHLPADMKYFKEKTMGHAIIMGRKNYESIPEKYRPLPGRTNIVVTRNKDFVAPNCVIAHNMVEAIEKAQQAEDGKEEVFIIGGAQIYEFALVELVDKMYITRIYQSFEGDVKFPHVDFEKHWRVVSREDFKPDEKNKFPYSFCVFERNR